jgi:hypothetical protein
LETKVRYRERRADDDDRDAWLILGEDVVLDVRGGGIANLGSRREPASFPESRCGGGGSLSSETLLEMDSSLTRFGAL